MIQIDYRLGGCPKYVFTDDLFPFMLIPDEIRQCVAFLGVNTPTGPRLCGTAFFVGVPSEAAPGASYGYVVTAKHILDKIREIYGNDAMTFIRVNVRGQDAVRAEIALQHWRYHPTDSTVDVAVIEDASGDSRFETKRIPLEMAATAEAITKHKIGVGDEVFMTGLFSHHHGRTRNLPIVRIGNIALMPDEPIRAGEWGEIQAYLIEARSIGGLSGSPVFVHLGGIRLGQISGGGFRWLGLIHGHWDLPISELDAVTSDALRMENVNMGIAIVVPVDKIIEVLNQEALMTRRKKADEEHRKKTAPTLDSTSIPLTKDEFKDTLKKVSQKLPQSDQGKP